MTSSQPPAKGSVVLGTEWLEYTPSDDATGTDTFSYIVEDRLGVQGRARVRIGIAQPSSSVKLAQIPTENNAHLGMEAFKEAYPLEYESYKMTASDSPTPTGYGSSGVHSRLMDEPEMIENWKGYAFSMQYDDDRGHVYALEDVKRSKRTTVAQQYGSCITCKSAYTKDVFFDTMGWDYTLKDFKELADQVPDDASIACATCHDVKTMKLRLVIPAQIEDLNELLTACRDGVIPERVE